MIDHEAAEVECLPEDSSHVHILPAEKSASSSHLSKSSN